jgi:hypothetical protein
LLRRMESGRGGAVLHPNDAWFARNSVLAVYAWRSGVTCISRPIIGLPQLRPRVLGRPVDVASAALAFSFYRRPHVLPASNVASTVFLERVLPRPPPMLPPPRPRRGCFERFWRSASVIVRGCFHIRGCASKDGCTAAGT